MGLFGSKNSSDQANDVKRLQEQIREQERRDQETRLERDARHRWEEKFGSSGK